MSTWAKIILITFGTLIFIGTFFYVAYVESFQGNFIKKIKIEDSSCRDSDGGRNYEKKGVIYGKINQKKYGHKVDTCFSRTQLTEYYCSQNLIKIERKKCQNGCKDGACLEKEALVADKMCTAQQTTYCCGNGFFELGLESLSTCPSDAKKYWEDMKRPVEKSKTNKKVDVICIKPCPYTDEVFSAYADKYFGLYGEITNFLGHYPPLYQDEFYQLQKGEKLFNKKLFPPVTLVLGDSNYTQPDAYQLLPSAAATYLIQMGCPTGICYNVSDTTSTTYIYKNEVSTIFKQLDFQGKPLGDIEAPRTEVHETVHGFIPTNFCSDWNHGLVMFLDNIITFHEINYSQYFDTLDYVYKNKIDLNNLPDTHIEILKANNGNDYDRAVGYLLMSGLYTYYGCDELCIKRFVFDFIESLNSNPICYGDSLMHLVKKHISNEATEWVTLMGLDSKDGLNVFKEKFK